MRLEKPSQKELWVSEMVRSNQLWLWLEADAASGSTAQIADDQRHCFEFAIIVRTRETGVMLAGLPLGTLVQVGCSVAVQQSPESTGVAAVEQGAQLLLRLYGGHRGKAREAAMRLADTINAEIAALWQAVIKLLDQPRA